MWAVVSWAYDRHCMPRKQLAASRPQGNMVLSAPTAWWQGDSFHDYSLMSQFNFHLSQKGFCSACQSSKSFIADCGNRHHWKSLLCWHKVWFISLFKDMLLLSSCEYFDLQFDSPYIVKPFQHYNLCSHRSGDFPWNSQLGEDMPCVPGRILLKNHAWKHRWIKKWGR